MMTLDEMKLAVCEKLPKLITLVRCNCGLKSCFIQHTPKPYWIGCKETGGMNRRINWPTEGLKVCHEAEKLLDKTALDLYNGTLRLIVFGPRGESPKDYSYPAQACIWNATYEQRLEALCLVWFPKRFQASPTAESR